MTFFLLGIHFLITAALSVCLLMLWINQEKCWKVLGQMSLSNSEFHEETLVDLEEIDERITYSFQEIERERVRLNNEINRNVELKNSLDEIKNRVDEKKSSNDRWISLREAFKHPAKSVEIYE